MTLDYLSNIVRPVDLSRSRADLRSSSTTNFAMPQLRTKCGERDFSHAGPAAWNALPEDMRAVSDSVLLGSDCRLTFLVLLLTFVDYCCLCYVMLCYVIPMLMTLVMHLCSPCNRRTINFYDDDDDDVDDDVVTADVPVSETAMWYECCDTPFNRITFSVRLRRKPLYYVVDLFVPCCALSVVSLFSLTLQPGCSDRLSLGQYSNSSS